MNEHETARLLDQFARAYDGEAWHGPPLRELLNDVDAGTAAAHLVTGAHSIWELVGHITFWLDAASRRLAGHEVEARDAEDWPPVASPTATAWSQTLTALDASYKRLMEAIRAVDSFDGPVPGRPYSVYVLLHGVLQHTLYHAGQIALLRRAVHEKERT